MARQRNSCEKCSFSSRKNKVTQGYKEAPLSGECFATQGGGCIYKHSITDLQILSSPMPSYIISCRGWFFCWVWIWSFCWYGLVLLVFCQAWSFGWLVGDFSRIIIYVLWKCLKAEANAPLWDTEHVTCELETVLSRAHTCPVPSGKLEAPYLQSNGDILCPGAILNLK